MSLSLQNQEFQISCPACGNRITLKFKEVGSVKVCPKCKNKIHLKDNNFKKGVKKVEDEIKKFEKRIENFGK